MLEKVLSIGGKILQVAWKLALMLLLGYIGMKLFVGAKQSSSIPDVVMFWQNVWIGITTSAIVILILYLWRMDGTGDMQQDIKDLKKQNKTLEDKLNAQTALIQQLVDKANQPTTNSLVTPTNLTNTPDITTKLASPDQAAVASNGHISNGS